MEALSRWAEMGRGWVVDGSHTIIQVDQDHTGRGGVLMLQLGGLVGRIDARCAQGTQ